MKTVFFSHSMRLHFLLWNKAYLLRKENLKSCTLFCKGNPSHEIAQLLFIRENTVNTHRQNMLKKSNKKNTAELISYLRSTGILRRANIQLPPERYKRLVFYIILFTIFILRDRRDWILSYK